MKNTKKDNPFGNSVHFMDEPGDYFSMSKNDYYEFYDEKKDKYVVIHRGKNWNDEEWDDEWEFEDMGELSKWIMTNLHQ